jgi:WD40 repeat protein
MIPGNASNVIDKPHDNKPITKIEVSPNEKYLITYSSDDLSIVGWAMTSSTVFTPALSTSLGNIGDEGSLKFEFRRSVDRVDQMCVSDNKELAYIDDNNGYLSKLYY